MMNNAWKLNEADKTYQKGWASRDEGQAKKNRPMDDRFSTSNRTVGQSNRPNTTASYAGS